jgi:hypothetical protein
MRVIILSLFSHLTTYALATMHAKSLALTTTLALITSVAGSDASWTLEFYSDTNCGGNPAVTFSDNSDNAEPFDGCVPIGVEPGVTSFKGSGELSETGGYVVNVWPNADCSSTDTGNGDGQQAVSGLCYSSVAFAGLDGAWGSFEAVKI